jgi:hypothetical protein
VLETAGYAIVVQGKIGNEEGLASHNKTTNYVYTRLKERGFLDEDIRYFNYNVNQPGVDGTPDKTVISTAITEWARDKMNAKPSNLQIILVDHGFDEVFKIDPHEITSNELGGWLNNLQTGLTGQARDQKIITILGFCRSGSFIDNLSGNNRVIITSAASDESSYKGPLDEDGIREGEYFISEFFKCIGHGNSVKDSFQKATFLTELFVSSSGQSNNAPFYDNSLQHPLFDDNGDGQGSNELSNQKDDGFSSSNLFIGVSSITANAPGNVIIDQVAGAQFLGISETSTKLWAKVSDNSGFSTIWLEIKPPDFLPVDTGGTGQAYLNLPKTPTTNYNDTLNRWEWEDTGGFTTPGTYQVFYFAKDNETGIISSLMETRIHKALHPNTPPNSFNLFLPDNDTDVLTKVMLDWQDTIDPEDHQLTYTILLSKNDTSFSDPIRIEGLRNSSYLLSPLDGVEDLSTYYWKVQAIDQYGAIRLAPETGSWSFKTNNTNANWPGWIKGRVYDATNGLPILNGVVDFEIDTIKSEWDGYYLGVVPSGTYTITATASGYISKSYLNVQIHPDGLVTTNFALDSLSSIVKGDLNKDNSIDLGDAKTGLKMMTLLPNKANVSEEVDGDGKIGLKDTIFIIQRVQKN